MPAVFDFFVNRIWSPIVNAIFSRSNTMNFRDWSSGNCFSAPSFSDDDSSLLPAKDFPLFVAFEALFLNSGASSSLGDPVKLDDLPWLVGDCVTSPGISQVQSLKPRYGMFRVYQ